MKSIYKLLFCLPIPLVFNPILVKATERMICVDDCDIGSEKLTPHFKKNVIEKESKIKKENQDKDIQEIQINHTNKYRATTISGTRENDSNKPNFNELQANSALQKERTITEVSSNQNKATGKINKNISKNSINNNINRSKIETEQMKKHEDLDIESNMPSYYHNLSARQSRKNLNVSSWVLVNDLEVKHIPGLNPGTHALAIIEADMEITPSVPQPIVAKLITGRFQGARLLGSATLDRDLHRILIHFHSMTIDGEAIKIAADTLDYTGKVGVTGEYISEDKGLMIGGFLSSFFAGFTESSVERHRNEQGNYVDEPTLSNQVKKGLTTSLSKASERLETRAGQMPGYTVLRGPTQIQVVFDELEGSVKK